MQALDAADRLIPYACDAGPVSGAVHVVDLLHGRFAYRLLRRVDAAGRLDARDGGHETGAGNPEARRHLARVLVLDNARQAERATGRDAERARLAPELSGHSVEVFGAVSHRLSAVSFVVASNAP